MGFGSDDSRFLNIWKYFETPNDQNLFDKIKYMTDFLFFSSLPMTAFYAASVAKRTEPWLFAQVWTRATSRVVVFAVSMPIFNYCLSRFTGRDSVLQTGTAATAAAVLSTYSTGKRPIVMTTVFCAYIALASTQMYFNINPGVGNRVKFFQFTEKTTVLDLGDANVRSNPNFDLLSRRYADE